MKIGGKNSRDKERTNEYRKNEVKKNDGIKAENSRNIREGWIYFSCFSASTKPLQMV